MKLTARTSGRQWRFSVRARLTALYGGLFLLAGAALLAIDYLLVSQKLPQAIRTGISQSGSISGSTAQPKTLATGDPPGTQIFQVTNGLRTSTLHTLLVQSGIALGAMAILAIALGWYVGGRALAPVHAMTATAKRLSAENLSHRIALEGPSDELKDLADTFDGLLERLDTAFESQRRFVSNASHELRTPLAIQRTLLEVAVTDPAASGDLRHIASVLLATNERSERLIEGLLVLARGERGLGLREAVDLNELVAETAASVTGEADQAGVTLHQELSDEPVVVVGDRLLLERLVLNLLQNAVRHNHRGGDAWVATARTPALLVGNTGTEIAHGAVPGLFEPFRRLTADRIGTDRGAGLGLSIVRSVATAHGGTATAHPRAGGGLVVAVELPVADRAGVPAPSPA